MTKKLSALIVVHNEGKQLNECLKTISFADEIIVILDRCSDNSEESEGKYFRSTRNAYLVEPMLNVSDLDDSEIEIEIDLKPLPQLVPMKTIILMVNTGEICYTVL